MEIKINIVDYQLTRKFVRYINDFIGYDGAFLVFILVPSYILIRDEKLNQIVAFLIVVFWHLPLFFILIHLFVLYFFKKRKGQIIIFNEYILFADKNKHHISEYCLDLNVNISIEEKKDKDMMLKMINKKYKWISKYGNFITNKKNGYKYEIELSQKEKLLSLMQHMDICLTKRTSFERSPLRYFFFALMTEYG
jgi:hypothetical protein